MCVGIAVLVVVVVVVVMVVVEVVVVVVAVVVIGKNLSGIHGNSTNCFIFLLSYSTQLYSTLR